MPPANSQKQSHQANQQLTPWHMSETSKGNTQLSPAQIANPLNYDLNQWWLVEATKLGEGRVSVQPKAK